VLLGVVVLLTAYWWWQDTNRMVLKQPLQTPWREPASAVLEQPEAKSLARSVRWQSFQVAHHLPAGEPLEFSLPNLERVPRRLPIEVTLKASRDASSWLELERERLSIRGSAPVATTDQTYRLSVRARAEAGSDSRLRILLTITGQPDRTTSTPQLRGHRAW
jgi:hypothetical protein